MAYKEVLGSVAAHKILEPAPSSENNWKASMLFCQTLADAIEKYQTKGLPSKFASTIEPFIDSILECATSERTQLSVQACRLTGNLAKVLGKDMNPFIDRIMPILIRHTASTKAVNQKSAAAAISNIIDNTPHSSRLLWHLGRAFNEKNVGPRLQATGWVSLYMDKHRDDLVEENLSEIATAVLTGLHDADSGVRTKSRALYWELHAIDGPGAERVRPTLNPHALVALDNDTNNPKYSALKPKPKESSSVRSESSLAKVRQQAKKRLQEQQAESNKVAQLPDNVQIEKPAPRPLEAAPTNQLLSAPMRRRIVATPMTTDVRSKYEWRTDSSHSSLKAANNGKENGAPRNVSSATTTSQATAASQATSVSSITAFVMKERKAAREGLDNVIAMIIQNDLDSMGYRRLKTLILDHGSDLIDDQKQFDKLVKALYIRLGNIRHLIYWNDPVANPLYQRQTISHILYYLFRRYPSWTEPHVGPILVSIIIARCASLPRSNEGGPPGANTPKHERKQIVETFEDYMRIFAQNCQNPNKALGVLLTELSTGEEFLMKHYSPLTTYAKWGDMPLFQCYIDTYLRIITEVLAHSLLHQGGPSVEHRQELTEVVIYSFDFYSGIQRRSMIGLAEQVYIAWNASETFWRAIKNEHDRNFLEWWFGKRAERP